MALVPLFYFAMGAPCQLFISGLIISMAIISGAALSARVVTTARRAGTFQQQHIGQCCHHHNHLSPPFNYIRAITTTCYHAAHDANNDISSNPTDTNSNANNHQKERDKKTRFRARVSYQGTPYFGWQLQSNTNNDQQRQTIQGEIESILQLRFNRRVSVLGAGRTDAGVHARGQCLHFDLYGYEIVEYFDVPGVPCVVGECQPILKTDDQKKKCNEFCNELQHSMNRMLPPDIRVFNLQLAPYTWTIYDDSNDASLQLSTSQLSKAKLRPWHVIQSATSKWYSYRFTLGPTLWNPKERYTRTHFVHRPSFAIRSSSTTRSKLRPSKAAIIEPSYAITSQDIERLQRILQLYVGTHDFKAFGGQLEQNEKKSGMVINTVRTVYRVELVKESLNDGYNINFGNNNNNNNNKDNALQQSIDHQSKKVTGFIGEEGNYRIDFLLQGALYKMVRNMVGTAMEVWMGRMPEEQLRQLLSHQGSSDDDSGSTANKRTMRRKDNKSKPASPEGLTLECVYYENDNF